jgi:hypothetical protein
VEWLLLVHNRLLFSNYRAGIRLAIMSDLITESICYVLVKRPYRCTMLGPRKVAADIVFPNAGMLMHR